MVNIMLFGLTSLSKDLCEKYEEQNINIDVYVDDVPEAGVVLAYKNVNVHKGSFTDKYIAREIKRLNPYYVIDAMLGQNTALTETLKSIAEKKYIKLIKDLSNYKALTVEDTEKAVTTVNRSRGNVLIYSDGSDIKVYTNIKDYKKRCAIVVSDKYASEAYSLGFERVITINNNFSTKQNIDLIDKYKIKYLITGGFGEISGFEEKYYACRTNKVAMVIIKPTADYILSPSELYEILDKCMHRKQISIIGIGLGNPDTMTMEAYRYIQKSEYIIGEQRLLDSIEFGAKKLCYEYRIARIKELIEESTYNNIAVLFSGDVCIHSNAIELLEKLGDNYDITMVQGVSSVAYLAAKLGINWTDSKIINMENDNIDIVKTVAENKSVFVFSPGNISDICTKLLYSGLEKVHLCIAEKLSYGDEKIVVGYPDEFLDLEFDTISIIYIENPNARKSIHLGIKSDDFISGSMSPINSELRAIIVSELELSTDSIVYDIGAGIGDVSIECANFLDTGTVYSIEKNKNAVDLITRNIDRFKIDNIQVLNGFASSILPKLPKADLAYIGNNVDELSEIFEALSRSDVNRIVMSSSSIEKTFNIIELAKSKNYDYNIKHIIISRGQNNMLSDNPMYIIKCCKKQ